MVDSLATIRGATPADIDAMLPLLQELFAIEADFEFNTERQRRGLSLLLQSGDRARLLVAEINGGIVGMCSLQVLVSTAEGGEVGLLEDLVVARQWRNRGIGRLLLKAMEQWAVAHGLSRLQLLADRHNHKALEFYQAMGWSTTQLQALRSYPGRDSSG